MSIKTEYITSDGFRFPEEQKELAEKHELYIEFLKELISLESFIKDCVDAVVPDANCKSGLKKNELYIMFNLVNSELSESER